MSRQIQIRRGTADQHENFIGAAGEITMDLTSKTLRVHDGETMGGTVLAKQSDISDVFTGDYVIETQLPTADNNHTWYRKYKSGWVEQGGKSTSLNVVFPIKMADTNYTWLLNTLSDNTSNCTYNEVGSLTTQSASGFKKSGSTVNFTWEVKGTAE